MRGEKAERVVAPVIGELPFNQIAIVEMVMDRQQFDRRHAQIDSRCLMAASDARPA